MKKITKILPIIIAASFLASCGNSSSSSSSSTPISSTPIITTTSPSTPTPSTPVPSTPTPSTPTPTPIPSTPEIETNIADFTFGVNSDNTASIVRYSFRTGTTRNVKIPEKDPDGRNVTSIERSAFFYAGGIESVTIPSTVTRIDPEAFQSLTTITNVYVDENNSTYASKDGWLLSKDETTVHYCPAAKNGQGTIKLIDGITTIGAYAFYYTTATSVDLDNGSLTRINDHAFCRGRITSIVIPDSVNFIAGYAFQYSYLDSITFGKGLSSIEPYTFANTTMFTKVTIPGNIKTIGESAFTNSHLEKITMEEGVETIGDFAFYFNQTLQSVTFPASLKSIGASAFSEAHNLKRVTLYEGITTIGAQAFYYNNSLSTINIPASVTTIGNGAFGLCSTLVNVTVAEENKDFVFKDGMLLSADETRLVCYAAFTPKPTDGVVTLPKTLKRIENFAFSECFAISTVIIPVTLEFIGGSVFTHNTSDGSSSLSITYEGTKEQWELVTKGLAEENPWNFGASFTYITCSDGQLDL